MVEISPFVPGEFQAVSHCPACLWPARQTGLIERGGFQFAYCKSCTTSFMSPVPTDSEFARYYGGPYWDSVNSGRSKVYRFEKQFRRAVLYGAELEEAGVVKGGKVLEIGSGFGGVVWALGKLLEMKPYAIELDPFAREFQERLGVQIFNFETNSGGDEIPGFDVVVLSHVLEHQLRPRELLEQAFSVVSSTGVVLIEVPHGDFVIDGGIDHPIVFSKFGLDRLLRNFSSQVRYRVHSGPENVVLPPKYLLSIALLDSGRMFSAVKCRVPRSLSLLCQSIATSLRNFGPLRGLNSRLARILRKEQRQKVSQLFASLPSEIRLWLSE